MFDKKVDELGNLNFCDRKMLVLWILFALYHLLSALLLFYTKFLHFVGFINTKNDMSRWSLALILHKMKKILESWFKVEYFLFLKLRFLKRKTAFQWKLSKIFIGIYHSLHKVETKTAKIWGVENANEGEVTYPA